MPTFHKSKQCLICSEAYKVMISLDHLWNELDTLNIANVLQNLHFPNISDVETIDGALCFTCLTKLHSCYQLKTTCDRIGKQLKIISEDTNCWWSPISTMPPLSTVIPKINEEKTSEAPITRGDSSKPTTTIDCSTIKSENDSEISAETDKKLENLKSNLHVDDITMECLKTPNDKTNAVNDVNIKSEIEVDEGIFSKKVGKRLKRRRTVKSHKKIDKNLRKKTFVCPICQKGFGFNFLLRRHSTMHTGEKPYVCDLCNKSFARRDNLVNHKMIHTGKKPHVCDVCERAFAQRDNLIQHKMIHTGEKPYECDVCKKAFARRGHLNQHKMIHTGEKPHACDVCSKSFNDRSSLRRHTKLTHIDEKS